MAERTINLDKVVSILAEKHDIPAYVGQTGGGTATILAGSAYPDDHGDDRYQALAGPGWFEGPGWTNGRATTDELYIGPDDDGQADPIVVTGEWDEAKVASAIAGLIN